MSSEVMVGVVWSGTIRRHGFVGVGVGNILQCLHGTIPIPTSWRHTPLLLCPDTIDLLWVLNITRHVPSFTYFALCLEGNSMGSMLAPSHQWALHSYVCSICDCHWGSRWISPPCVYLPPLSRLINPIGLADHKNCRPWCKSEALHVCHLSVDFTPNGHRVRKLIAITV